MTLESFRIVIGETTPKERYLLPQKKDYYNKDLKVKTSLKKMSAV